MTPFCCVTLTLFVGVFSLSYCFYWVVNVGADHALYERISRSLFN